MISESFAYALVQLMRKGQAEGWQCRLCAANAAEIVIEFTPFDYPEPKAELEADLERIQAAFEKNDPYIAF